MHLIKDNLLAAAAMAALAAASAPQLFPRDCLFTAAAEAGDTCSSMAEAWFITENQFKSYNPGVNCASLTPGKEYCVEWTGALPPPITTTAKTSTTSTTSTTRTSTTTSRSTSTTSKTTTSTSSSAAPAGPTPVQEGISKDCNKWHKVSSGDTCQIIVDKYKTFTLNQFYSWNPAVGTDCSLLWLDYYVCIGVKGGPTTTLKTTTTTTTKTTTKTTSTAPAGPSPTQPNVNNKCKKWHLVSSGDFCQKIADQYKITLANFYQWNPDVGNNCATLWLGYYVCVGL
ncbi:hypothetical protein V8F20_005981 [Naviculisporaceae sp. PSN 640]